MLMPPGTLPGRRAALILLTVVELLVFLDISVVNIALPSIATGLAMTEASLAWVVNAYQLTFGGFQLVGGRFADLLGRRAMFWFGLALFTLASLLAGVAPWAWLLVAARALQGVGAAILVPAELALLTAMFTDPAEYRRAFGVWSAMGAAGAASGVALGGIITQGFGWPWIFLINVPIGLVAMALSGRYLPADPVRFHLNREVFSKLDLRGASTGTAGLVLLVYVASVVLERGWDMLVISTLVLGVLLFGFFVLSEARVPNPILPLRLFRVRNVTGSAFANFFVGAAHVPAFVFLSLYFQDVLKYPAIVAGFAVLPIALVNIAVSRTLIPRALKRFGPRALLATGFVLLAIGLGVFGRAPVTGSYLIDILPAAVVFAVGLPAVFVGSTLPAVKSVPPEETGIASGTVNTAQRIGSSIGVTILIALASHRTATAGGSHVDALNLGYQLGFLGAAALAALGAILAVLLIGHVSMEDARADEPSGMSEK